MKSCGARLAFSSAAAPLKTTAPARPRPLLIEKRACLPSSPIGRTSSARAQGTSSRTAGLPSPNGPSVASCSATRVSSASGPTIASIRSGDHGRAVRQLRGRGGGEGGAELVDAVGGELDARGGAVAAEAVELLGAGLERGEQIEAGDAAAGAAGAAVGVDREQH